MSARFVVSPCVIEHGAMCGVIDLFLLLQQGVAFEGGVLDQLWVWYLPVILPEGIH